MSLFARAKNFYGASRNSNSSVKNFLGSTNTVNEQYTQTLQEQKDSLLEILVSYVDEKKNARQVLAGLANIEQTIMTQCARIANTPGCC